MDIAYAFSSCKAIFDQAFGSQILRLIFLLVFVLLPTLKVVATIIRTKKRILSIKARPIKRLSGDLKHIFHKNQLSKDIFLISANENFLAFSIGFFSRKIILSKSLLKNFTVQETEAIILHELYHVRAFHTVLLFISELVLHFFFFLPFLQDIHFQIKVEFEKAADMSAVKVQKTQQHIRSSLKKALLFDSSVQFSPQFSYHVIDQRIDRLNARSSWINFNQKRLITSVLVMVLFLSLFLLNKRYAMAYVMEETINCGLFDCVRNCVAYEFSNKPLMSEINYSFER